MSITMHNFKLVVADLAAAERFYAAMGLQVVSRNTGGEDEVRQAQCWMSETGDMRSFMVILTQFLEIPPPPPPIYPGQVWMVFTVPDVDAMVTRIVQAGGAVLRAGQDRPEHKVRAAVAADPEGHPIELVGPMLS
jgi:predicted enzyme related to lactoylglutathione lyase